MAKAVRALCALAATAALALPGLAAAAAPPAPFERAVRQLTGQWFAITCLTPTQFGDATWAGLTELDSPPRIFLAPQTCDAVLHRPGTDAFDRAFAIKTLTHEAGHAFLTTTCEYGAETYAMANWRRLYRLLTHTTPDPAQIAYVNATHKQLPPEYRTPDPSC